MNWHKIIEEFCKDTWDFTEGDLIPYPKNPKSESWIRLDPNPIRKQNVRSNLISNFKKYLEATDKEATLMDLEKSNLLEVNFSIIIISKDENLAIRRMKSFKPHRDWNLFEIDEVYVDGELYYVVWD